MNTHPHDLPLDITLDTHFLCIHAPPQWRCAKPHYITRPKNRIFSLSIFLLLILFPCEYFGELKLFGYGGKFVRRQGRHHHRRRERDRREHGEPLPRARCVGRDRRHPGRAGQGPGREAGPAGLLLPLRRLRRGRRARPRGRHRGRARPARRHVQQRGGPRPPLRGHPRHVHGRPRPRPPRQPLRRLPRGEARGACHGAAAARAASCSRGATARRSRGWPRTRTPRRSTRWWGWLGGWRTGMSGLGRMSEAELAKLDDGMKVMGNLKGRVLKPESVARAALYLASDEADYVSGLNMVVDGGFSVVNPSMTMALAASRSNRKV
ncbi:uncharacterized protein J3R85_012129 [Psidium guajava]|nr:uncharacterized protein J3R85_012129 [Psidium guajava]